MLTPDKIKEKQFQSSGRGSYRADDVDVFMNEVSASYEQMFKENGDLIRKISILAKKVEEYRADEESLKLALLNAQKLADQIVSEAKEKAEKDSAEAAAAAEKQVADAKAEAEKLAVNSKRDSAAIIESAQAQAERIVAAANKKSDEILGNINRKVTHETLVFDMTKKEAVEFKHKLVEMYKEHINLINQLPDIVDEQLDAENSAVAVEPAYEEPVPAETADEETALPEPEETVTAEPLEEITEPEAETPAAEPVFEDFYSDSAEQIEDTDVAEPAKEENPFKLDLSKIDFSDDDDEPAEEAEPVADNTADDSSSAEDEDDEDDGSSSISFKNFFKKK